MTSPVYSALPQELLLEAEPRRPGTKQRHPPRVNPTKEKPLNCPVTTVKKIEIFSHVCNNRGWPRGSRLRELLPFYPTSGGEPLKVKRWSTARDERAGR